MPDLFHITRTRDVDAIFRDGLVKSATSPAQKQREEIMEEQGGGPAQPGGEMVSPTEQAERWFDEVVADAKRAVDGAEKFPVHQPAVFFWPTRHMADQSAKSVNWSADIVAVSSDRLPDRCRCAIGPTDGLDAIFKDYYDTARDHGSFDPEEQFERAKEWWRRVEWYEGQGYRNHEIWCGCDIPHYAIDYIYDRSRGTTLYEPPEEGQGRLLDFVP